MNMKRRSIIPESIIAKKKEEERSREMREEMREICAHGWYAERQTETNTQNLTQRGNPKKRKKDSRWVTASGGRKSRTEGDSIRREAGERIPAAATAALIHAADQRDVGNTDSFAPHFWDPESE